MTTTIRIVPSMMFLLHNSGWTRVQSVRFAPWPVRPLARRLQPQILVEPEVQNRFGRNFYFVTLGEHFSTDACARADRSADGGALTTADNGSDQCSDRGASAHHDRRTLICANSR